MAVGSMDTWGLWMLTRTAVTGSVQSWTCMRTPCSLSTSPSSSDQHLLPPGLHAVHCRLRPPGPVIEVVELVPCAHSVPHDHGSTPVLRARGSGCAAALMGEDVALLQDDEEVDEDQDPSLVTVDLSTLLTAFHSGKHAVMQRYVHAPTCCSHVPRMPSSAASRWLKLQRHYIDGTLVFLKCLRLCNSCALSGMQVLMCSEILVQHNNYPSS